MSQVAVRARFRAKEGRMVELLEALSPLLDQADAEPGTLVYAMNRSPKDPGLLFFYELYADRDAFHTHARSETMAAAGPVLEGLVAESELVVGGRSGPKCCRSSRAPVRGLRRRNHKEPRWPPRSHRLRRRSRSRSTGSGPHPVRDRISR
jgi:quinol monooxygenase YgiN